MTEHQRAYRRAYYPRWYQARRARWRAAHCCPQCGVPTQTFLYCFRHRLERARNNRRYERRIRAKAMALYRALRAS